MGVFGAPASGVLAYCSVNPSPLRHWGRGHPDPFPLSICCPGRVTTQMIRTHCFPTSRCLLGDTFLPDCLEGVEGNSIPVAAHCPPSVSQVSLLEETKDGPACLPRNPSPQAPAHAHAGLCLFLIGFLRTQHLASSHSCPGSKKPASGRGRVPRGVTLGQFKLFRHGRLGGFKQRQWWV